jgi:hypothetical protein
MYNYQVSHGCAPWLKRDHKILVGVWDTVGKWVRTERMRTD